VVTLHAAVDAAAVSRLLCSEGAGGLVRQERCVSGVADSFGLILPRFKQRFTLLRPDTCEFTAAPCGTCSLFVFSVLALAAGKDSGHTHRLVIAK